MFTSQDFVVGQSVDLKDVIISVTPEITPFTSLLLTKEVKADNPTINWIEEELGDSASTLAEGANAPDFVADTLTNMTNYCELWGATATVSNTAQYSTAVGISDLLARQVANKTKAIKLKMENQFINGTDGGYDKTTSTYTTNGILELIAAGNKVTNATLTAEKFEETLSTLYDAGVNYNMICFCPADLKKTINGFETMEFYARDKFAGVDIEKYYSVYGTVSFVLSEKLTNQLFVVNPDFLELATLIPFHGVVQSANGSKQSVFLETQAGIKLLNSKAAASFSISAGE